MPDGSAPGGGSLDALVGPGWLGVEFRHLSALAAVARTGSFRRAADNLGYVQSAISAQIAQLERAVGAPLVERSSGSSGATLTPAGRTLLGHVEEILARFEAARVDLSSLAEDAGAVVRVGIGAGAEIGQRRLPAIVARFHARCPEANLVLDEGQRDEHNFERLASGEIDLMITELPLDPGPFDHVLLARDSHMLLVAADSPLAARADPPSVSELARLPLILPASTRREDRVAARLRESLIDRPAWLRPRSAATAQALVAAGLGAAIVPRLAIDERDASVVAVAIPGLVSERSVVLAFHREREYSEAVTTFIELAEAGFADASS